MSQIFSSPFFKVYGVLWKCAIPFLRRSKRLKDGWHERILQDSWNHKPVDLWLQAASGGESRIVISLLEEMAQRNIPLRIIVCTWTRQGYDLLKQAVSLIEQNSSLEIMVRFAPLDDPKIAQDAIRMIRPKILALVETELWPSLMAACVAENIPVYVINGRMARSSFELYKIIIPILRTLSPKQIFTISEADKSRFSTIFPESDIHSLPNVKLDQASINTDSSISKFFFSKGERVLLLASVRRSEETILAPILQKILSQYPNIIVIVAPRHMGRVLHWRSRLYALGMRPVLASEHTNGQSFAQKTKKTRLLGKRVLAKEKNYSSIPRKTEVIPFSAGQVVVWDMFGNLPDLYMISDVTFVGGSISAEGGQNFLEALSSGIIPIVGQYLDNFYWALGEDTPPSLRESGMIHICKNSRGLRNKLLKELENSLEDTKRQQNQEKFQDWLEPRKGSVQKLVDILIQASVQASGEALVQTPLQTPLQNK